EPNAIAGAALGQLNKDLQLALGRDLGNVAAIFEIHHVDVALGVAGGAFNAGGETLGLGKRFGLRQFSGHERGHTAESEQPTNNRQSATSQGNRHGENILAAKILDERWRGTSGNAAVA